MNKKILNPQPTEKNPVVVDNYPYGYKRTQIRYWVESVKKKGDRFVSQTLNPKTQEWNKPKKSTYSGVIIVYKNLENNHIKGYHFSNSTNAEGYNKFMDFVGDFEFNELQKEELKILRAYIKAYEGVTFKCVEMNGLSEEERTKYEEEQKGIQNQINYSIANNYANDTGSL